jgi:SAM-dependent methyltransferase
VNNVLRRLAQGLEDGSKRRRFVRWMIRLPSPDASEDAEAAGLFGVVCRVAKCLDALGASAVVEDVVIERGTTPDGELVVTVRFDRSRMKLDPGWLQPGVAASYDGADPLGPDGRFMLSLADQVDARTIVDLGCGTGVLARALAVRERRVIGVDPSLEMPGFAREQPGAERVEWVDGYASAIGSPDADLIVITGNVIQGIHEDVAWDATLRAVHRALRAGGCFAFGSRNPAAREWERWGEMYGTVAVAIEGDYVRAVWRTRFDDLGGTIEMPDDYYRFRTADELTRSLAAASFTIERIHGDWDGSPLSETSPNIVLVARKL